MPGLEFGVKPHRLSMSKFIVDVGDRGPLSAPSSDVGGCWSSPCWYCGVAGMTVCRGMREFGKPNITECSRSAGFGEKAGGVGGKLPGGVIQPASGWQACWQLSLDKRFRPCNQHNCNIDKRKQEKYILSLKYFRRHVCISIKNYTSRLVLFSSRTLCIKEGDRVTPRMDIISSYFQFFPKRLTKIPTSNIKHS